MTYDNTEVNVVRVNGYVGPDSSRPLMSLKTIIEVTFHDATRKTLTLEMAKQLIPMLQDAVARLEQAERINKEPL